MREKIASRKTVIAVLVKNLLIFSSSFILPFNSPTERLENKQLEILTNDE